MKQTLKMFDEKRGRDITLGLFDVEVFTKIVDSNKHFMGKYHGYGMQIEAFMFLKEKGITTIQIIDQNKNKLKASLETWETNGKRADEGYGVQIFLPVSKMDKAI